MVFVRDTVQPSGRPGRRTHLLVTGNNMDQIDPWECHVFFFAAVLFAADFFTAALFFAAAFFKVGFGLVTRESSDTFKVSAF